MSRRGDLPEPCEPLVPAGRSSLQCQPEYAHRSSIICLEIAVLATGGIMKFLQSLHARLCKLDVFHAAQCRLIRHEEIAIMQRKLIESHWIRTAGTTTRTGVDLKASDASSRGEDNAAPAARYALRDYWTRARAIRSEDGASYWRFVCSSRGVRSVGSIAYEAMLTNTQTSV